MEENWHTQSPTKTDLEQFGRQLISEFKKELEGFRDQLLGEMKKEQEAFHVKLLAEVKEHTTGERSGAKSAIVPAMVPNTKEGVSRSQENTRNPLPLVSQPTKQEQTVKPRGVIPDQTPRRKRIAAIQQERLAMDTALSNDSSIARGVNDPTFCHEQETGNVHALPIEVSDVSSQQTLSPFEIERICKAFIRLLLAKETQPDGKER